MNVCNSGGGQGDYDAAVPLAVLERNWNRWGYIAFATSGEALCSEQSNSNRALSQARSAGLSSSSPAKGLCLRKGVGSISSVRRPRYNLTDIDPTFFESAAGDPLDFVSFFWA